MDTTTLIGHVSQSSQWGPFNPEYTCKHVCSLETSTAFYSPMGVLGLNTSTNLKIYDDDKSILNSYMGLPTFHDLLCLSTIY